MLKEDKIASFGAPGCTDRTEKNSNIITLVTMIIIIMMIAPESPPPLIPPESPLCKLCGNEGESVQHVTSGCENWLKI